MAANFPSDSLPFRRQAIKCSEKFSVLQSDGREWKMEDTSTGQRRIQEDIFERVMLVMSGENFHEFLN